MMILEYRLSTKKPGKGDIPDTGALQERPPPYTKDDHGEPSHMPQASGSQPRRVPPLPSPSVYAQPLAAAGPPLPPPTGSGKDAKSNDVFPPGAHEPPASATVSQMHLTSKNEAIVGRFYIDPQTIEAPTSKRTRNKGKGKGPTLPWHASFRTHSGDIQLQLGTHGDVRQNPSNGGGGGKAKVFVGSSSGNITVEVLPNAPPFQPRIGLEVTSTRHGNIMVHLPDTFSGLIQLNTRSGVLQILPALAHRVKVLKSTTKEAIVLMGADRPGVADDPLALTDLCQLTSRSGKVIVGLAGQDRPQEKEGFWKKLGSFFK